jgi:uncharacterized damage-inducible protein DinB
MRLAETLLPEFDHEMSGTRKTIERIPEDKLDWKPHEKSTDMGGLATHLANIPSWVPNVFNEESFDAAPGGQPLRMPSVTSRQEALDLFDRNVSDARAAIAGASDELFLETWTLLAGGKVIFSMPRIAVLRGFILNHTIHHRAQLGVYLRLNDVPVPSLYGPSADEGAM